MSSGSLHHRVWRPWLRWVAALSAWPWTAWAQVQVTNLPSLSLAEAKGLALQRNWDLLAAKSGVDSATAQLLMAKEFPNPNLTLSTAKVGNHNDATSLGNGLGQRSYDTIAAVSQLIEVGGKRGDRQAAARAGLLGAKARFFDAQRTLDQGITKAYIAAVWANENERILTESARLMRKEADIGHAQFAAGAIAAADLKTLEVNAEQFEVQARSAAAAAQQARIAVEVLLGSSAPQGRWRAAETLSNLVAELPAQAEAKPALDAALRPDVLAAETDVEGAEAQLKLQRAERLPDPTFSVGVEHNPPNDGPPEDTLNFAVSFPLPLWNRNGGEIRQAQAQVDQYREALGKARTQAQADVAVAESAYAEAHARWLRYRNGIAPKSAQVRDSVAFQYEKGAAALVDLLNAEQTDNTVRLGLAQAMNDTASAAADWQAAQTAITEAELRAWKP